MAIWKSSSIMITSLACISFPNGPSKRRVKKADLVKVLPNPRTKIAESPITNAVILDFAVIIQILPPKTRHLQRVLQWYICTLCQKTAWICKQSSPCQGRSLKKITTQAMSMKRRVTEAIGPWLGSLPRYSELVFMMTITAKRKETTEASASVGLLLATALLVWDVYIADPLKQSAQEKRGSGQCRKVIPSTGFRTDWKELLGVAQNKDELYKFLANEVKTIPVWCALQSR